MLRDTPTTFSLLVGHARHDTTDPHWAEDMTPHRHHKIRDTTNTIGRRIGARKAATATDTDPHQEQKNHQRETHPAVAKADEHPRHTPEPHPPTDRTNTAPEGTDYPQTGVKGHPPLTEADHAAQTGTGLDHTARTEQLQGTDTNPGATMKKTLNGQSATS